MSIFTLTYRATRQSQGNQINNLKDEALFEVILITHIRKTKALTLRAQTNNSRNAINFYNMSRCGVFYCLFTAALQDQNSEYLLFNKTGKLKILELEKETCRKGSIEQN